MESLENKNTKEKTRCEIGGKVFEKQKKQEVQHIERAELNKHLAGFIRSVRHH